MEADGWVETAQRSLLVDRLDSADVRDRVRQALARLLDQVDLSGVRAQLESERGRLSRAGGRLTVPGLFDSLVMALDELQCQARPVDFEDLIEQEGESAELAMRQHDAGLRITLVNADRIRHELLPLMAEISRGLAGVGDGVVELGGYKESSAHAAVVRLGNRVVEAACKAIAVNVDAPQVASSTDAVRLDRKALFILRQLESGSKLAQAMVDEVHFHSDSRVRGVIRKKLRPLGFVEGQRPYLITEAGRDYLRQVDSE